MAAADEDGQHRTIDNEHDLPYVVLCAKDIATEEIRVKKPTRLNHSSVVFNMFYGKKTATNKKLLVQTPVMVLAHPLLAEKRGTQEYVQAVLGGHRKTHDEFYRRMEEISDRVFGKLSHAYPSVFSDKVRSSCIKLDDDAAAGEEDTNTVVRARLKNVRAAVSVFDTDKRQLNHNMLMRNDSVVAIFSMEYVWSASMSYGFECRLVQLRKVAAIPLGGGGVPMFSLNEEELGGGSSDGGHILATTRYPTSVMGEKYMKMLKVGVPFKAVKNAMVIDGVLTSDDLSGKLDTEAKLRTYLTTATSKSPSVENETSKVHTATSSLNNNSTGKRPPPPPPPRPPSLAELQQGGKKLGPPRPPPPPPPPPPFGSSSKNVQNSKETSGGGGGMLAVLGQIARGQFSLRPKSSKKDDAKQKDSRGGNEDGPSLVPTLSDILGAKSKLRSTKPNTAEEKKYEPHEVYPFLKDIRNRAYRLQGAR